ncbi:MAG TPA: glycogen synthase [Anaerolineae bacterium]|nr:glycogen synthase [Anaerolineae bacterium]
MDKPLKILFLSAEVDPFAKTGGLGDVAASLPIALKALGHDVRVVMPAYRKIEQGTFPDVSVSDVSLKVPMGIGLLPAGVFESTIPNTDVPVYFIAERNLFDRDNIYGYRDDPYRFAFFSRAALDLTVALQWKPDILHAHDWHAAPAIMWLSTTGQYSDWYRSFPSIFTIHNLAHQGHSPWDILNYMGMQANSLREEAYGQINFMARGIYHATMINTVSPSYAREIMTREGGAYLEELLRHRHFDVHGILNGLDYDLWNPATDTRIEQTFSLDDLDGKKANKRALQAMAGLPQRDDVPLFAMVSRLDYQKGLDIMGQTMHLLLNGHAGDAQFVVLGTGADEYENMFRQLASYHNNKMTAFLEYNADMAALIYAGSDMFLMPSRFEPCGLSQMISMRYGTIPVVRATGGLADTVQDAVNGVTFTQHTVNDFWQAIQRACYVYNIDKPMWANLQRNAMQADYSWDRSARRYEQMYGWALSRHHNG